MMVPQYLIHLTFLLMVTLAVSASFAQRLSNSSQSRPGFRDQVTMDGKTYVRATDGTLVQQNELVQYERTIGARANKSPKQIDALDSSSWFWLLAFIPGLAVIIWWFYRCPTCGKSWALGRTGVTAGSFFRGKEDEYICRHCGHQKWRKRTYPGG